MLINKSVIRISIVIVTWNARQFALECLDSLVEYRLDPCVEIIVVDNASSDGTPEIINRKYPFVRVIQNARNFGFAKANNIGMLASRGRYVCLINSDVVVPRDCLEKMASYLDRNPTIGVLGPQMIGPDGTVGRSCMSFPTVWACFCRALALDVLIPKSQLFGRLLMTHFAHDRIADVEVLNGWFWMIQRKAIENVGLLDERFFMYGEDVDWCKRFHNAGWRIVYFADAEAIHYGGASSSDAPIRFYIEMHRARLQYWRKHHSIVAQKAFIFTAWLHLSARMLGYAALYLIRRSDRSRVKFKIQRSITSMRWLIGQNAGAARETSR
ncbi:MAG: glycosyltransferase family 2 protein [Candidatus Acidiferrales bacterium]